MLDYDAMRSKVKRLVEKPDKDASKLPRAEKETEMVMDASPFSRTTTLFAKPTSPFGADDLTFPSPPKALDGLKHKEKSDEIRADEDAALASIALRRSSSVMNRVSRVSSLVRNSIPNLSPIQTSPELPLSRLSLHSPTSPSLRAQKSPSPARHSGYYSDLPVLVETSTEARIPPTPSRTGNDRKPQSAGLGVNDHSIARHASMPVRPSAGSARNSPSPGLHPSKRAPDTFIARSRFSPRPTLTSRTTPASRKKSDDSERSSIRVASTPFFTPSELEDLMHPLKQKFAEEQADLLEQAKAAYEQLNQQLTDELPQLIDLR